MSDDAKASIVQNVLDRKFSRANAEFANLMRDKAYAAIDDFKNAFKYVAVQKSEPEKSEPEKKKEAEKKEK
tara:strand:- start:42 stop:254 length:213 start_codon:yes stop_codon:yes gene_type:complete